MRRGCVAALPPLPGSCATQAAQQSSSSFRLPLAARDVLRLL